MSLHGIMVALYTPFTPDQSAIDAAALDTHIQHLIAAGVHGLVPGGSTGEFTALTLAERKQLTELVIASAAGRVPVIVGTGALTTADTVALSAHAAHAGAAAVMVVPPFYDAVGVPELHALLRDVRAAVAGLPVMYYNIPAASGLRLSAPQLAALGVEYVKDTSGDAVAQTELLVARAADVTVFNGWDTLTFYGLAAGARGAVWGAANIVPALSVQLWDALAVQGDLARGRELWKVIYPICRFLEAHNYAAAVKAAVELLGGSTGGSRKPFMALGAEARRELAGYLTAAGLAVVQE